MSGSSSTTRMVDMGERQYVLRATCYVQRAKRAMCYVRNVRCAACYVLKRAMCNVRCAECHVLKRATCRVVRTNVPCRKNRRALMHCGTGAACSNAECTQHVARSTGT